MNYFNIRLLHCINSYTEMHAHVIMFTVGPFHVGLFNHTVLHTYVSRVQGNKLKSKHEIRIGSLFKKAPEEFLAMIVVHELAHLKEKEHNKSFYKLCQSMLTDYHQLELDLRIYLTQVEEIGDIYVK